MMTTLVETTALVLLILLCSAKGAKGAACGDGECTLGAETALSCAADCAQLSATLPLASDTAWQRASTSNRTAGIPTAGWTTFPVPGLVGGCLYAGSWFRRTVTLPSNASAFTSVSVYFLGAKWESRTYIDGALVGEYLHGYEPFEHFIGERVQAGATFELAVRVWDWTSTFADPEAQRARLEEASLAGLELRHVPVDAFTTGVGGHYNYYGFWDELEVRMRPPVHISDAFVVSSVRNSLLTVTVTVSNTADTAAVGFSVRVLVFDADTLVKAVGVESVGTIQPHSTSEIVLSTAKDALEMWSPSSPKLYYAVAVLEKASSRVHEHAVRFGFREIWAEKDLFVLNGQKMHFLAAATWPPTAGITRAEATTMLTQVKEGNVPIIRLHTQPWPEIMYTVADELGVLIVLEGPFFCDSTGSYRYNNESFWENWQETARRMVLRDRNHPSIVMWSVENEIVHCGGRRFSSDLDERLAAIATVIRTVDSSRLVTFESDWDPMGSADVIGMHYPHEFPENVDYPNTADWINTDTSYSYWGTEGGWNRTKPLYIGEFLHVFGNSIEVYAAAIGTKAYPLAYSKSRNAAKTEVWRWQLAAYRQWGVSGICPWTMFEDLYGGKMDLHPDKNALYQLVKDIYTPTRFFLRNINTRFFSGSLVSQSAVLVNDAESITSATLSWALNGAVLGSQTVSLEAAEILWVNFTFTVPDVTKCTTVPFVAKLARSDGTVLFTETVTLELFPTPSLPTLSGYSLGVFDPRSSVTASLQAPFTTISDLSEPSELATHDAILIGAHALDDADSFALSALINASFAKPMKIIVLEQDRLPALPINLYISAAKPTWAFVFDSAHPLLDGISEDDLRFWASDNYVARNGISGAVGKVHTLVEAPSTGMKTVHLLAEWAVGCSRWVFSQLGIGEKHGTEPIASKLLGNMLSWLPEESSVRQLGVFASGVPGVSSFITSLGFEFAELTSLSELSTLEGPGVAVFAGSTAWSAISSDSATFEQFVTDGGVALLHGVTGADYTALTAALGIADSWAIRDVEGAMPPLFLERDWLTDGISSRELYWEMPSKSSNTPRQTFPNITAAVFTWAHDASELDSVVEMDAADFEVKTKGSACDSGRGWALYSTGTISSNFPVTVPGKHQLVLEMRGTIAASIWPIAAVSVNGVACDSVSASSTTYANFSVAINWLDVGNATVSLTFTNDFYVEATGEDRNLYIRHVMLGHVNNTESSLFKPVSVPAALVRAQLGSGHIVIDNINWHNLGADTPSDAVSKASNYVSKLLLNLGAEGTSTTVKRAIQATEYSPSASGVNVYSSNGVGVVGFYAKSTVTLNASFASNVLATLIITGFGSVCEGDPLLNVTVDDAPLLSHAFGPSTETVETVPFLLQPNSTVVFAFVNDYYKNSSCDRNLRMSSVYIATSSSSSSSSSSSAANYGACPAWASHEPSPAPVTDSSSGSNDGDDDGIDAASPLAPFVIVAAVELALLLALAI